MNTRRRAAAVIRLRRHVEPRQNIPLHHGGRPPQLRHQWETDRAPRSRHRYRLPPESPAPAGRPVSRPPANRHAPSCTPAKSPAGPPANQAFIARRVPPHASPTTGSHPPSNRPSPITDACSLLELSENRLKIAPPSKQNVARWSGRAGDARVYDDQGWHKIECPTCGANVSVRTRPAKATRLEPPAAFQCRHTPIEHCPDLWPRIAGPTSLAAAAQAPAPCPPPAAARSRPRRPGIMGRRCASRPPLTTWLSSFRPSPHAERQVSNARSPRKAPYHAVHRPGPEDLRHPSPTTAKSVTPKISCSTTNPG